MRKGRVTLSTLAERPAAWRGPFAKPEARRRVKARRKRQMANVIRSVRAAVVARARGCCERCGRWCGTAGHAHHRRPRSRGGTWTFTNIQWLCPDCHRTVHAAGVP